MQPPSIMQERSRRKMDKGKFYTVKKKFGGKEYVAQFSGVSTAVRAIDQSRMENGAISTEELSNYIFEHVIVDPKRLTADDFEDLEEFNKVTQWARDVMYGKFRDAADKK